MPERPDLIGELTAEHRAIDALFDGIRAAAPGSPERKGLADDVTARLTRHAEAEERHLHPAVRRYVADGSAWVERELADHGRIDGILREVADRGPEDPLFTRSLVSLVEEVSLHVLEEEERLFPRLRAGCPPDVLRDLGGRVRADRRAPAVPVSPPPHGTWGARLLRAVLGTAPAGKRR
ncbi:hemerythrin domain-containing protein [Streptomyces sp. NPDC021100]|uniref:hemerythrin domain-containing protein n=1 Tax=Streptomyces sp. NPDC021100 TaxID=3365114 RepID=UPI0037A9E9CA